MCGKFTQMYSWREVHGQLSAFTIRPDDRIVTVTPMRFASVLRLNAQGERESVAMRWGFARAGAAGPGARPGHIHARAESIDAKPTFRDAFFNRRGLVVVKSFNEGLDLPSGRTEQHTISFNDGRPVAIAVLWEGWTHENGETLLTFVMATTEANALICTITDRMPAIVAPADWGLWLGETQAAPEEIKKILKPFAGDWSMAPEKKPRRPTQSELF